MKKYFITIAILFGSLIMYAQQGFVTTGGNTKNANGSVAFSVGQLDYQYFGNGSNLVIEGLQQPFEISGALPVTLLYFSAKTTTENTILINWSTTSEFKNDFFTIERSRDGNKFEVVKEISSAGNSNLKQDYTFTDLQPYTGISYYRLKQTDKDGKYSFSPIERVNIGEMQFSATASPNPTRDIVQLKISGDINKKLNYFLIDVNGKILMKADISNIVTPINLGNFPQGMYILKIFREGKVLQSFKVIKQN